VGAVGELTRLSTSQLAERLVTDVSDDNKLDLVEDTAI
jgi:hypothetical protein